MQKQNLSYVEELSLAMLSNVSDSIKRYRARCPKQGAPGQMVYVINKKQVLKRSSDGDWDVYVQLVDRDTQGD